MAAPISATWRPSDAVYDLLAARGVSRDFADDQLPEFILYWSERGAINHSWGAKFVKHCVREFVHHQTRTAREAKKPVEIAITQNWRPSNRAVEHLSNQGISMQAIEDCVATFVLYWSDRGDVSSTWNSKFVEHVQHNAARSRQLSVQPAQQTGIQNTRDRSLHDDLTDRSWAK